MDNFIIEKSTKESVELVDEGIIKYNNDKVPFTQEIPFIAINRVMKDNDGTVIAGINTLMYCWKVLYIDVL